MTQTAKDQIDILKKAQDLDREIYLLEQQQKAIPEERAKIKQELEAEKSHCTQLESDLKKVQLKQKEKEGELAQKESNIKKLDGQLSQVKTNKEYTAMQQEIASLKADNSLLEEEIIKSLDQVDAAEDEVKRERERLKSIEKEFQCREGELVQKEKTLSGQIQDMKNAREAIVKEVPPDVQNLYNLIVQKKHGVGLVKVNGEICGACRLQLRPQLLNEIRLGKSLVTCENCSRILYIEE